MKGDPITETSDRTENILKKYAVKTPNVKDRKRCQRGIDPDLMCVKLLERGYDITEDESFEITQQNDIIPHLHDDTFSNFITKEGFEQIVTQLRRKRDESQTPMQNIPMGISRQHSIDALQDILNVPKEVAAKMVNDCLVVDISLS